MIYELPISYQYFKEELEQLNAETKEQNPKMKALEYIKRN